MKIFVDSDVIISSLLSSSGAAYRLLHTDAVASVISSISQKEIEIVVERLGIEKRDFTKLSQDVLEIVQLETSVVAREQIFQEYVLDINDAHIVHGAKEAEVRFLITYNLKDFKIERIKEDFNIIILTPGQFLQYLRSLK
jgi:predicted nucleic acid-binding protein